MEPWHSRAPSCCHGCPSPGSVASGLISVPGSLRKGFCPFPVASLPLCPLVYFLLTCGLTSQKPKCNEFPSIFSPSTYYHLESTFVLLTTYRVSVFPRGGKLQETRSTTACRVLSMGQAPGTYLWNSELDGDHEEDLVLTQIFK